MGAIERPGGGGGIRTHVTVSRKHAFQACAFSHSATPPYRLAQKAPAAKLHALKAGYFTGNGAIRPVRWRATIVVTTGLARHC
jgi:hypothetical protein